MKAEVIKREDILSVLTENYENLDYGGSVPASAVSSWGARAIFENGHVSLLHDRQAAVEASDVCYWINSKKVIKELELGLKLHGFSKDMDDYLHIVDGKFHLLASPNASYGYLYITAWKTNDELEDQQ